jgi:hypothetical protein
MSNSSRGLKDAVVCALAKVGLVWSVAVLGALFMAMSAQGQHDDGGYSLSATGSSTEQGFSAAASAAPHTAGLVLALAVLAGGATILAIGAARGEREVERPLVTDPDPVSDLPLALGLGFFA